MDVDGIGLILGRASELRSKISTCIQEEACIHLTADDEQPTKENSQNLESNIVDSEAEKEVLCSIRDAFQSLEAQLSSLQVLQQQQYYERETALAEIDYSRQKLLKKLKDYKGEHLEVLSEATAFASETVEDNDLLLPPYPSRPSRYLVSGNGFLSHLPSTSTFPLNELTNGVPLNEMEPNNHDSEKYKVQSESKSPFRLLMNMATKTVLALVGVVGVLSLAGFDPKFRNRNVQFKVSGLVQRQAAEEKIPMVQAMEGKIPMVQCPPGKVLVVEDGEARCLVKERVEVPFRSVDLTPNVTYGCG
ncbi:Plastid division protein PDV2 [Heracleum sosnowskyi]|uniref:Plastid division protein PDV2 n=1 Tax=Heracleum sosnowskyi TaxID=360622 RepID=A0AAD8N514_9APIA|nr:Plastid division protein PDV2 [Heracleum sosnowskyi]